jgi:hypothetical protein
MKQPFKIKIGLVQSSPNDSNVLFISGTRIEGDLCNGAEGVILIESSAVPLRVLEVAFLERAHPNAIMFSVQRPSEPPAFENWIGAHFQGTAELTSTRHHIPNRGNQ